MSKTENKSGASSGYAAFKSIIGKIIMFFYHMRKIVLAVPVAYAAIRIAIYNGQRLPTEVGLFLQNNGEFLRMIDRPTAVFWPAVITFACLFLMMFSRKALYAWAISVFTLALPLLILISNIYPA